MNHQSNLILKTLKIISVFVPEIKKSSIGDSSSVRSYNASSVTK